MIILCYAQAFSIIMHNLWRFICAILLIITQDHQIVESYNYTAAFSCPIYPFKIWKKQITKKLTLIFRFLPFQIGTIIL